MKRKKMEIEAMTLVIMKVIIVAILYLVVLQKKKWTKNIIEDEIKNKEQKD